MQTIWATQHDKTNKMTCAPNEDSDQSGHPRSLIRDFAVRSMGSQGPNIKLLRAGSEDSDRTDYQTSHKGTHNSFNRNQRKSSW